MNSYSAMADMYYIGKSDRECMQNALCVEMKAAPLALMLVKSYHMLHNTDIFAPRYRKKKFPPMWGIVLIVLTCPHEGALCQLSPVQQCICETST